jgi:hypothetical protein
MTPEEKSDLLLRLLGTKNLVAAVVEIVDQVRAEEREACAKLADGGHSKIRMDDMSIGEAIAAAIRARP